METPTWDGTTRAISFTDEGVRLRTTLADAARNFQWDAVLDILREHPQLANVSRLDATARYAPLHQAATGYTPSTSSRN